VVRGRSDVRSIRSGPEWQRNTLDQGGGKLRDFGRDVQDRKVRDQRCAALSRVRIPATDLVQDNLRDEEGKRWPPLAPPDMRHLLTSGYDQVAARTGREVADDAGFDVDTGAHPLILPPGARSYIAYRPGPCPLAPSPGELLLDFNAVIDHRMQASSSGCEGFVDDTVSVTTRS